MPGEFEGRDGITPKDNRKSKLTNKSGKREHKGKNRLIKVNPSAKLPPDLPKNLVYLSRCETRVDQEDRITNE